MLETIRQIGVFMIAAQAVVHFAPGRQYEKYICLLYTSDAADDR